MTDHAITVRGANKRFGDFVALDNVDFDVPTGSLTALLGPSGSGKSTLLRAIAGLDQPDTGTITINGRDVTRVPPQRRDIGFVFQHYAAFKHFTVWDNIAFGLKIRRRPKAEITEKVDNLLGRYVTPTVVMTDSPEQAQAAGQAIHDDVDHGPLHVSDAGVGLAKARDDEEGVVDAHAETDHQRDLGRDLGGADHVGEHPDQPGARD